VSGGGGVSYILGTSVGRGLYNHSVKKTIKPAKKTKITKHLLIKSRESFILLR